MPKAVFVLKSVIHRWEPPFSSTVSNSEVTVGEGQHFDSLEDKEGHVFRLLRCDGNKALVEFNPLFTLKGHEHPGNRQVWVGRLEPVDFTYLWGNDGVTKSLQLKEIVG